MQGTRSGISSRVWGKRVNNPDEKLEKLVELSTKNNQYYSLKDCARLQLSRLCLNSPTSHHHWLCTDNYLEVFTCKYCGGVQFLPNFYNKAVRPSARYGVVIYDKEFISTLDELKLIPFRGDKLRVGLRSQDEPLVDYGGN